MTTLRPARIADVCGLAKIFLAARRAALPYLPELHSEDETRAWMRTVLDDCDVWLTEDGGRPIGFAALAGDRLEHLYIHPGHWRRGIGSALLRQAKTLSSGFLTLYTFQRNGAARRFYEKHGFTAVEFGDGGGNEEGEPDVRYEWRAGAAGDNDRRNVG